MDQIIREGGILDAHLENLLRKRFGPGREKYLEEFLFAMLLANCLILMDWVGPGSRSARE